MDFIKSVFSDPSPTSTPSPSPPSSPIPESTPSPSWAFGSTLFQTITTKSESVIGNYYKDFQEFSSGLKKETSVIREAASRAVQDLPARLESGAAIAQESLEAVGQAIDNVGYTVSEIIGKDLNFASTDDFSNSELDQSGDNHDREAKLSENVKPYSRIEAIIRGLQCNIRTYCDEIEESGYSDWKLGFRVEEKREEIEKLFEENGVIKEIYEEIVPVKVNEETFWCRYFYRVDKVIKAEEARVQIVKRAISQEEEEELSWDVDDDDDDDDGDDDDGDDDDDDDDDDEKDVFRSKDELKKDVEEKGKGVDNGEDVDVGEGSSLHNEKEGSEGKLGSDISVISSQRTSHAEDDLGWDEIEDIESGDERKVGDKGSSSNPDKAIDSTADDDDLTWDVGDDYDEEPVKL